MKRLHVVAAFSRIASMAQSGGTDNSKEVSSEGSEGVDLDEGAAACAAAIGAENYELWSWCSSDAGWRA